MTEEVEVDDQGSIEFEFGRFVGFTESVIVLESVSVVSFKVSQTVYHP